MNKQTIEMPMRKPTRRVTEIKEGGRNLLNKQNQSVLVALHIDSPPQEREDTN